jgi:hypothetical protein
MEHMVLIGEMFGLEKTAKKICLQVPFRLLLIDTVLLVRYLCIFDFSATLPCISIPFELIKMRPISMRFVLLVN